MNPYINKNYYNDSNMTAIKNTKNAVNNNNFNKCNYIQHVTPNDLYDAYNGFIRGNMFPDLYNQYKISKPFDVQPINEQAQLLTYIDAYSFAAHDINLYLDTHPDDRSMIELYNQYKNQCEQMIKEYENKYGPLLTNSDALLSYPWAWNDLPWPWENK